MFFAKSWQIVSFIHFAFIRSIYQFFATTFCPECGCKCRYFVHWIWLFKVNCSGSGYDTAIDLGEYRFAEFVLRNIRSSVFVSATSLLFHGLHCHEEQFFLLQTFAERNLLLCGVALSLLLNRQIALIPSFFLSQQLISFLGIAL